MKLIYDGNNIAYRANSVTELYTRQGERTSAIFGTLNSLKSDIEYLETKLKQKVEEIFFVWDFGKSERRMTLFPDYKKKNIGRTEDDEIWYEEFLQQAEYLHNNFHKFGVKSLKIKGWEADDLVYALTKIIDGDLLVVSTDEDYFQLINDHVAVFSPIKRKFFNNQNFNLEFGIPLSGFIAYKALKGDSSDKIPGIYGIGDKTSKALVNKYGNLGGIIRNKADLMKSKRTKAIFNNLGILDRNVQLMDLSLVDFTPVKAELKAFMSSSVVFDSKAVMEIFKEKQFVSLLTQYNRFTSSFKNLGK